MLVQLDGRALMAGQTLQILLLAYARAGQLQDCTDPAAVTVVVDTYSVLDTTLALLFLLAILLQRVATAVFRRTPRRPVTLLLPARKIRPPGHLRGYTPSLLAPSCTGT